jgi:hypothetical protein
MDDVLGQLKIKIYPSKKLSPNVTNNVLLSSDDIITV